MKIRNSLLTLAVLVGGAMTVMPGTAGATVTEDCTYNTSASGVNFHVKCSRLPTGISQYRAVAQCGNSSTTYGIWKTVAQSVYIGSVADCTNRNNVTKGGIQLR